MRRLAAIRWYHRGDTHYAELRHSVRRDGRVHTVRLAWFGASGVVTDQIRRRVATEHPDIEVDWEAVSAALRTHRRPSPEEERVARLVAAVAEPVLYTWYVRHGGKAPPTDDGWPPFRDQLLGRSDLAALLSDPAALDHAAAALVHASVAEPPPSSASAQPPPAAGDAERPPGQPHPGAVFLHREWRDQTGRPRRCVVLAVGRRGVTFAPTRLDLLRPRPVKRTITCSTQAFTRAHLDRWMPSPTQTDPS